MVVNPGRIQALQGRALAYRQVGMKQAAELNERSCKCSCHRSRARSSSPPILWYIPPYIVDYGYLDVQAQQVQKKIRSRLPVNVFHMWTVLSTLPEAIYAPLGDHASATAPLS